MLRRSSSRAILPPPPLPPSGPVRSLHRWDCGHNTTCSKRRPWCPDSLCSVQTSCHQPATPARRSTARATPSPRRVTPPHFTPDSAMNPPRCPGQRRRHPPPSGLSPARTFLSHHPLPTSDTHCCKTCVSATSNPVLFLRARPSILS